MSAAESKPVISVRGLTVDFALRRGPFRAVSDVSFDLLPGRTLCIVGESGSGKTVTGRALMQIVGRPGRVVGGSIELRRTDDSIVDLAQLDPRGEEIRAYRGRDMAMIFQEPMSSMSPVHTIGFQIIEALQLHLRMSKPQARARAIELLRSVEIPDPERTVDGHSFEYSGGMLQRAMIAMALAGGPRVLIADEPTTALDVTTQAEILDLMKRLQQSRDMALLLITHDLGIVAEVADEVAVMRHGKIVEHRPVDAIFHDPQHPYTRQLLASTVKLEHGAAERAARAAKADQPILSVRGLTKDFDLSTGWFKRHRRSLRAVELGRPRPDARKDAGHRRRERLGQDDGRPAYPADRRGDRGEHPLSRQGGGGGRRAQPRPAATPPVPFRRAAGVPGSVRFAQSAHDREGDRRRSAGRARHVARQGVAGAGGGAADVVGLDPQAMERYPHAFSGGQRQRIGIARALALDPRIIIADEATSALDVSIRSQILDLLLAIQKRLNLSFIFISHDISVVRYFCDTVAVMHRGRVVEVGTADQICTAPREDYTKALISAVPSPDPRHKRMMHRVRLGAAH